VTCQRDSFFKEDVLFSMSFQPQIRCFAFHPEKRCYFWAKTSPRLE